MMSKETGKKKSGKVESSSSSSDMECKDMNRANLYDTNQSVRVLCDANGYTKQEFADSPGKIVKVEMFQEKYFDMDMLRYFRSVADIWILSMSCVKRSRGLESLDRLRTVTISNCKLEKIEGLESCTDLRELHLQGNCIKEIEGLASCTKLKVLWLDHNEIKSLGTELSSLAKLEVLSVARNKIETIGKSLDNCKSLQSVNVAGNKISSFSDILRLSNLKRLRDLKFGDPHFGTCPVCHLANYNTYVLYNIPQISTLDSLIVTGETKKLAEATYTKKKMYYNMRIKTLKQRCASFQREISSPDEILTKSNELVDTVRRQIASFERAHFERAESNNNKSPRAQAKLSKLKWAVRYDEIFFLFCFVSTTSKSSLNRYVCNVIEFESLTRSKHKSHEMR